MGTKTGAGAVAICLLFFVEGGVWFFPGLRKKKSLLEIKIKKRTVSKI
jgi:hypothetical protein